jgi:membrane protein required for colicin V production
MGWVDYAIVGIIAVSALVGLARGLVRELLSIGIWVSALLVAWLYYHALDARLVDWISSPSVRKGAAVLILVFAVLFVGALIGHLIASLVDKTGLTGTDRLLGVLFGAARGALLVAMLTFLGGLTPLAEDTWWRESMLMGRFQAMAERLLNEIPPELVERAKAL